MSKITLTGNSIQRDQFSHAEYKFENRIYFDRRIQKLEISGSNMTQFKGFYKLLIPISEFSGHGLFSIYWCHQKG